MRTYEFRLYPNREQRRRLDMCLIESRHIYNEMLEREKQHYAETGTFLSAYDRGLARSRLAKSILDAAWGAFLDILTCKAGSAGGQVVRINPRYTTQKCSKCGELVQKSLSVRTHICSSCGYVADRDVNAAQNILRAGTRPSGTLADGLADEPRSRRL